MHTRATLSENKRATVPHQTGCVVEERAMQSNDRTPSVPRAFAPPSRPPVHRGPAARTLRVQRVPSHRLLTQRTVRDGHARRRPPQRLLHLDQPQAVPQGEVGPSMGVAQGALGGGNELASPASRPSRASGVPQGRPLRHRQRRLVPRRPPFGRRARVHACTLPPRRSGVAAHGGSGRVRDNAVCGGDTAAQVPVSAPTRAAVGTATASAPATVTVVAQRHRGVVVHVVKAIANAVSCGV